MSVEEVRKMLDTVKLVAPVHLFRTRGSDWAIYVPRRYACVIGLQPGQRYEIIEGDKYVIYIPSLDGKGKRVRRIARKHCALPVPYTFVKKVKSDYLRLVALEGGVLLLEAFKPLDPLFTSRRRGKPVEG
ncbi:MAG: hypothetical protein QXG48_02215, partial [Thermofilaceae archaeon]